MTTWLLPARPDDAVLVLLNQSGINGRPDSRGRAEPRTFTYDPVFNQTTSIKDELGRETRFDIDPTNGNTLSVIREFSGPGGNQVTSFSYKDTGQVETVTDPLGRVSENEYDDTGRLVRVTFARGKADEGTQRFEYDDAGNQTAFVDENGNRTEFEYDPMNRLITITEPDPDGSGGPLDAPITSFVYDDSGNLIETTDARGNTTQNEYDERDRLIRTTDANGQVTQFRYDLEGNLIGVIDPLGHVTTNRYDARNRLIQTIDPEGGVTRFAYDGNDNLIVVIDPVQNLTRFAYDARDRLVVETDPLGEKTEFIYDAVDNLVTKIDRNDRTTEFVYDDLDRLATEIWTNADDSTANEITYAYDAASNLLSVQDTFSALAFSYDARDRVKTVDNAGTPGVPQVLLEYVYDAGRQRPFSNGHD